MAASSFEGRVIAITGAASGMGLATAHILHSRGASLALADVQVEALEKVAAELSSSAKSKEQKVVHTVVDVSKTDEVNSWIEKTVSEFGKLDGAANIAGVVRTSGKIQDTSDEDWEWVMGINSSGVFKCLRAELKQMVDGGAIVNVASVAGLMGCPGIVPYCASKHAVIGLTKTAAREVGSRKIRVNAVAPGLIDTPMLRSGMASASQSKPDEQSIASFDMNMVPLKRIASAEEVARSIAYLLSEEASYITGEVIRVDGGLRT